MTRGISDMLNIPHLDDVMKKENVPYRDPSVEPETESQTVVHSAPPEKTLMAVMDEVDLVLKTSQGTDHEKSMDEIFQETLEHSRSLMDLGFNTDERSRRGIFEIATSMYKNALDAKNSKRDAQLKLMKLITDQKKHEFEELKWRAERGESLGTVAGSATLVEDRNEIIRRLRAEIKDDLKSAEAASAAIDEIAADADDID